MSSKRRCLLILLDTILLLAMLLFLVKTTFADSASTGNGTKVEASTSSGDVHVLDDTYGLDVSFPIHHRVSTNYPSLLHNLDPLHHHAPRQYENMPLQTLGDRHDLYLRHLEGCRKAYAPDYSKSCDIFEYDRMLMNRRQPQSMVNLTETGWKIIRAPSRLKELIDDFWEKNSDKDKLETWVVGNSYVNSWDSPTTLVSVDDKGLRGSGPTLKEEIWAATSAVAEEWTQQELQPCSLYGIRVYHEGAIMLPHVDRLPLVVSAMINVAQDVDEDWPLEIYDHQDKAHNITLKPGDMLLFETGSVIHGHPFPLKGRFYASIFIHYEPTGREYQESNGHFFLREGKSRKSDKDVQDVHRDYHQFVKEGIAGPSASLKGGLPPYIKRESPEEEHWRKQHPLGWEPPYQLLPPDAHVAAKSGQLKELERELEERGSAVLTERDDQGWQILHQGVAGGNEEVVKLLIASGAEINARTHGGYGETPLRIAEKLHGTESSISMYLKKKGALSIGPEL